MPRYLAIIKMQSNGTPYKLTYDAANAGDAVDKMVSNCNKESTNDFSEFEIFELLEDGDAMRPVAYRAPGRGKGTLPKTFPEPKVTKAPEEKAMVPATKPPIPSVEAPDKGYKLVEA